MLLYDVVILDIYVSFSAFVWCFFKVLYPRLCESKDDIAQIGRQTPTKCSYFPCV